MGDLIDAESPREDRHGRVLAHAAETLRDLGPDRAAEHVLAHGDPHAENALARGDAYAFMDPDGLRAEPACDVGVALRDEAPGSSNSTGERMPPRGGAWLATAAHLVG